MGKLDTPHILTACHLDHESLVKEGIFKGDKTTQVQADEYRELFSISQDGDTFALDLECVRDIKNGSNSASAFRNFSSRMGD